MSTPRAETRTPGDDPVAATEVLHIRSGGEDFGDAFVAGDGAGGRGAEGVVEVARAGVFALDLVDVGWVYGGGEEADGDAVGVGWGDGVGVVSSGLLYGGSVLEVEEGRWRGYIREVL